MLYKFSNYNARKEIHYKILNYNILAPDDMYAASNEVLNF